MYNFICDKKHQSDTRKWFMTEFVFSLFPVSIQGPVIVGFTQFFQRSHIFFQTNVRYTGNKFDFKEGKCCPAKSRCNKRRCVCETRMPPKRPFFGKCKLHI